MLKTFFPIQISVAAAASELTHRERYRSFFRTLPSFEFYADPIAAILREFGWKQMAIITQNEALFNGVRELNIIVVQFELQIISPQITETLRTIFNNEGWILDDSALINSNANPFPYETAFSWVCKYDFTVLF